MSKPKPESKTKGKRGGARPGAGRKPKASTVLRDQLRVTKADDAEYAYNLFAEAMRSGAEIETRLDAAREVMNRVWGKPPQAVIHKGHDGGPLQHKHSIDLSGLSDDELDTIGRIAGKLAPERPGGGPEGG